MRVAACHSDRRHYANDLCKKCYNAKWRLDNAEYDRSRKTKWRRANLDKDKERAAKKRKENPEYMRKYEATRRAKDMNFNLRKTLRARLHNARKGDYKSGSAVRDLGCSISQFR